MCIRDRALIVGMSVTDVSQKAVANLGWSGIKMTFPLFVGDTLYAESEVLEKRESKSRPGAGIVTCKSDGYNQDGKLVCTFNRTMLIARQGHCLLYTSESARASLFAFLASVPASASEIGMRINPLSTALGQADLKALAGSGLSPAFVMPVSYTHLDVYKRQTLN